MNVVALCIIHAQSPQQCKTVGIGDELRNTTFACLFRHFYNRFDRGLVFTVLRHVLYKGTVDFDVIYIQAIQAIGEVDP